jgi:hypothetical protein
LVRHIQTPDPARLISSNDIIAVKTCCLVAGQIATGCSCRNPVKHRDLGSANLINIILRRGRHWYDNPILSGVTGHLPMKSSPTRIRIRKVGRMITNVLTPRPLASLLFAVPASKQGMHNIFRGAPERSTWRPATNFDKMGKRRSKRSAPLQLEIAVSSKGRRATAFRRSDSVLK